MSQYLTAKQIGQTIGKGAKGVLKLAQKEKWDRIREGRKILFPVEGLPPEIRAKVLQALESPQSRHETILPPSEDLDLSKAKELIQMWESAAAWNRAKASLKNEILTVHSDFIKGKQKTRGTKEFVHLYNYHSLGLNISEKVYKAYPHISKSTLYNWQNAKMEAGLVGLLEDESRGKPGAKMTPEMETFALACVARNPNIRAIRLLEYIQNKFQDSGVEIPSYETIRNWLNAWKSANRQTYTFMKNPNDFRARLQSAFGDHRAKAKYFLHIVEFDASLGVIGFPDGTREKLTGAVDTYSGMGMFLSVPNNTTLTIANCLIRKLLIDWGKFDVGIFDNGPEYDSGHMKAVLDTLEIEAVLAPSYTPEFKAMIERRIGSLKRMLCEELPGFVGQDVPGAEEIRARRRFVDVLFKKDQIAECPIDRDTWHHALDTWNRIMNQRPHSKTGKSPIQRAGESPRPVQKIEDHRLLDILLAPVGTPTVQKKGISYQGGIYAAVELADYIGHKVEIRLDLADAGAIHVFQLDKGHKGDYICTARDTSLEPFTLEEAKAARKRQKARIKEQVRALKTLAQGMGNPMLELLEAKGKAGGQLYPFNPQEIFENEATRQISKAFDMGQPIYEEFQASPEELEAARELTAPKNDGKVVPLHEDQPFFASMLERYRYLKDQEKIRGLTPREREIVASYETSPEYDLIFVAPYR